MEKDISGSGGRFEKWVPFLLYGLITIIYSFRFFEPGKMIFGHDLVLMSQYFDALTYEMLKKGNFPFWNPYVFSGLPHFGSLSAPVFYPTYFIYPLLNLLPHLLYMFEYILCIFLSGSFMYLFVKNLGLSKISSFLAGVFFMFSGQIIILINAGHIVNIQAITYIPIIFYFFDKGIQKEKIIYFLLASCFLGIQCFSLGFQIMAYTSAMLFMYLILKIILEKKSFNLFGYYMLTLVTVPLIAAVQFLPSYYYNKLSYRAAPTYEYFVSWSFPPAETITFLFPRFFGFMEATYWGYLPFRITSEYFGILPVILAFMAVIFLVKDKRVLCFAILSFITLLLAFGGHTPLYKLLYHFPVISSFRNPSRWITFFTFNMVVLAGFGVDFLVGFAARKYKKENFRQIKAFNIVLITLAACFLLGWIWIFLNGANITSQMRAWEMIAGRFGYPKTDYIVNTLYKMIADDLFRLTIFFAGGIITILLAFNNKLNKHFLAGCLLVLYLSDMWYIGIKAVKIDPITKLDIRQEETIKFLEQDKSPYRVLPLNGFSSENWFTGSKIQSLKGYTISLKDYRNAMDMGIFNNINYLSLLNTKYILTTNAINYPAFKLVFDKNIKIYQNLASLPRASFYNKIEVIKNKADCMNKIMSPDFNIYDKLIINEDFEEKLDPEPLKEGKISITEYEPNNITLNVENPGNSVLFLSEIYYPEWKAEIDGKEAKIYQADGLFRAVYLTKGSHLVKFYYSAKLLYIGLAVSIATIACILIIGLRLARYPQKD